MSVGARTTSVAGVGKEYLGPEYIGLVHLCGTARLSERGRTSNEPQE